MTQREKLVKLIAEGRMCPVDGNPFEEEKCLQCKYAEDKDCDLTRLADFLLENGIIVPPCKVGDTVYCDGKYFASHCAGEVMEFPVNIVETTVISTFRGEIDVQFDFDDFGKTVFLTKEEAEKALAEKESD